MFGVVARVTCATSEAVTSFFLHLFRDHGLPSQLIDGWVTADSGCLKARARVFKGKMAADHCTVQVDLEIVAPGIPSLLESSAGLGPDWNGAVLEALRQLCDGSFHVIFSALSGHSCTHCETETWEIGGTRRQVIIGPSMTRASAPDRDALQPGWFQWIERSIQKMDLRPGFHWIRLYHCESTITKTLTEALLNNGPCQFLEEALASYQWPAAKEFYSVRLFMIVRDLPTAPASAGQTAAT